MKITRKVYICKEKLRYQMKTESKLQKEVAEYLKLSYARFSVNLNVEGFREFQLRMMCDFLNCNEDDLLEE